MVNKIKNLTIQTPGDVIKNFYNKFSKTDKLAFVSSFVFWMIAHLYMYVNDFFIYDSVQLFNTSDGVSNGRFLIYPILSLFANCQIPLVIGIVSALLASLSVMFICRILQINKTTYILLTAALVVTFPVIYKTHSFLSSVQIYMLALLSSVLAVYFVRKKTLVGYLLSAVFLFISLACYQAYMPFAVCLFLLSLLIDALENKKISTILKDLIITAMVFIVSTAIYYCVWQLLIDVFNIAQTEYRGETNTLSSIVSSNVFTRFIYAYVLGVSQIFSSIFYSNESFLMSLAGNLKMIAPFILILLVLLFFKNKKTNIYNALSAIGIIFMLPLGMGLIFVFSSFYPHTLMVFPIIVVYLGIITLCERLIDNKKNITKIMEWIVVVVLSLSVLCNVVIGSVGYSLLASESKSALSFATRIVDRIESTPGISIGTNVCFVSDEPWFTPSFQEGYTDKLDEEKTAFDKKVDKREEFKSFVSAPYVSSGIPYVDSVIWYIDDNINYLELNYSYQDLQDGDYANNKQVQQLQPFPAKNCSVWINDTLVVRL